MIKVVSGGQTGVDRAALDVALTLGFPCGGWCPKGRIAEDGTLDSKYPLQETESDTYSERTKKNVLESDGTLVLGWGVLTLGTVLTVEFAKKNKKPCLIIDLKKENQPALFTKWVKDHAIKTLNVAGPRASRDAKIYPTAYQVLTAFLRGI